jgi:hypothetical protein
LPGKWPQRLARPRGKPWKKFGALPDHQRLIRQFGILSLMYQYGETVAETTAEISTCPKRLSTPDFLKTALRDGPENPRT